MSPHIHILLPLAGTLVGLGLALVLVRIRSLSVAGYSRKTYRAIEGTDLKTGLLMAMVALLLAASIPLVAPLLAPRVEPGGFIDIPVRPTGPIVFPQPPTIDPKGGNQPTPLPAVAHTPTLGVPKPMPDTLVSPEDDVTSKDAVELYGSQNATPDSVIAQMARDGHEVPPAPGDFVPHDRQPRAVAIPKPVYPDFCINARIEGTAMVYILLDKQGRVAKVSLLKGSGSSALDEAALAAASGARFTPAMQGDTPVSVWISLPFTFKVSN